MPRPPSTRWPKPPSRHDEARLVEIDGHLLAVIPLQNASDVGSLVHVEAYFHGDAPDTFGSLEARRDNSQMNDLPVARHESSMMLRVLSPQ